LDVSGNADWKQKYRDLLREGETAEKRWVQIERVLRRLVNRLCAAGIGVHPQLDTRLEAVAAANRRGADAEELERLAAELTTVVAAVDDIAPVMPSRAPGAPPAPAPSPAPSPRARRWDATCTAVASLLQILRRHDPDGSGSEALQQSLGEVQSDEALASIVLRTAELVEAQRDRAAADQVQATAVLADVGQRLEELVVYFAAAAEAQRGSLDDTVSLNASVLSRVRALSEETAAATDLAKLQAVVSAGLESVGEQVREFRARAEARLDEQTARTTDMQGRIALLEGETRQLSERLADERNRARIDPLTHIANRKAFDERLAQEIARKPHTDGAVSLLIWDIDDFKSINDTYGHRAGDKVLQTVAKCLAAAVRSTDFLARIGGEELAIVLVGQPPPEALRIADELRAVVEALRFHFRGTPVRVTISCGVAALADGDGPESVFDRADAALYRAKHAGKNRCISG
jgi:diguanylate cyclase